jgi:hypothetical protein
VQHRNIGKPVIELRERLGAVSAANGRTSLRLLLTTRNCANSLSASGGGISALMAHGRTPGRFAAGPAFEGRPNKIVNI